LTAALFHSKFQVRCPYHDEDAAENSDYDALWEDIDLGTVAPPPFQDQTPRPISFSRAHAQRSSETRSCRRDMRDMRDMREGTVCTWTGEWHCLQRHLQEVCPMALIRCSGCDAHFDRRQKDAHFGVCPKREVECDLCEIVMKREEVQSHQLNECLYRTVHCPDCGEAMPLAELEGHQLECLEKVVQCKYHDRGCEWEGKRGEHDKHLAHNYELHLDLACAEITSLSRMVRELERVMHCMTIKLRALQESKAPVDLCSSDEEDEEMDDKINENDI
jgi:hypothetical protein